VISAVLLAAGASRRFGAQKLLQLLDGKAIVRWSAENLIGEQVDELLVIVADDDSGRQVRNALTGVAARFVVAATATEGMASSLAAGIAALDAETSAALVALGDEPLAGRAVLEEVVRRHRAGGAQVVVPRFRGTRGHPVLFDRAVFPELVALRGDHGARAVADRDPARVAFVDLDMAKPVDVDTPSDLARLRP
jgi:molybdenum cofactor cytidylyltransferase